MVLSAGLGFPGQPALSSDECLPIEDEIAMVENYREPITVIRLDPDQEVALRAFEVEGGAREHPWDAAWLMYRWRGEWIEVGIGFAVGECAKGWYVVLPEMVLAILGVNLGKTKR